MSLVQGVLADVTADYPHLASRISVGIAMIRVAAGLIMVAHGVNHLFGGGRIEGTGRWFASLGMKPGKLHAWLATITEIGAGALFALGLLTPLAAAGIIGLMAVAVVTVHRFNGFFIVKEGWEYTVFLAVAAAGIATTGAGEYSLDYAFGLVDPDVDGPKGLAIAAGVGLVAAGGLLAIFYRPPKDAA